MPTPTTTPMTIPAIAPLDKPLDELCDEPPPPLLAAVEELEGVTAEADEDTDAEDERAVGADDVEDTEGIMAEDETEGIMAEDETEGLLADEDDTATHARGD